MVGSLGGQASPATFTQFRVQRMWLVLGPGHGGSGSVVRRAPVIGTSRQSFACKSVSAVPTLEAPAAHSGPRDVPPWSCLG